MKSVAIITKKFKPDALEAGRALKTWLEGRGVTACHFENEPDPLIPPLPADVEFIVVMGGDGTILSVARHFGERGVPIFGVNLGGLGFLTEISLDELYSSMAEHVLTGKFEVEERMMLTVTLFRQRPGGLPGKRPERRGDQQGGSRPHRRDDHLDRRGIPHGLPGRRAHRRHPHRLHRLQPVRRGTHCLSHPAPPHPAAHLLPHPEQPAHHPAGQVTVAVTLDEKAQDVYLTLDGQVGQAMEPGDRVEIRRAPYYLKLVKSPHRSHFEILRTKLGWGELGVCT